jgi:tetratricopeptide (TPR) repeat protein
MPLSSQFHLRSSLLGRITWSSILSLGIWSMGMPPIGILYASAQTVPSTIRGGYTLLDQGLVNQAIARFERAIQQYPQSLEAQLGLAIAYRRAGRDADAFQAYERVLTLDANNRLALLSLGTLGGFRPEWQARGIAALTTLLQQNPDDTEARSQRALLYIYEGQFDAAIADYELVLQQNPGREAIGGAAQAYAYEGDYEQSLALFDRYRQGGGTLQGDAATAYARALRETGDAAAAVQVLEPQIRQQSGLTSPVIRMRAEQALNYAAIGRLDLISSVLAPLRGRSDARMVLGRTLIAVGRTNQNSTFLEEGITLFRAIAAEENTPTVLQREIAAVLAGFPESQSIALEIYQQLAQQQPNDRGIQTQIAVLEYETEQQSEADLLTDLAQILRTLPPEAAQKEMVVQALIRLRTPNPQLLPLYENLVRAGVTEPLLYFRIAQMYLRQADFATARSVISTYQANLTEPTDPAAELLLANIDQREGNLQASARRYQSIIDSNPQDKNILSGALQGLAGIYQGQKRYRDAMVLYNRVMALNPNDPVKRLGQAALEYQAGVLGRSDAEAILNEWLTTQPLTLTPPELYSLVGALPAEPSRELLYRTLVQTDPSNIPVQARLVEVIARQNAAAAMTYIDELIARDPENIDVYFLQGNIAQEFGDLRQAAAAYEAILSLTPENIDALSALGGVRFRQRRYQSAVDAFSQVLTLQPDNAIARTALTDLEQILRRRVPALRQTEQVQQVNVPAPSALSDLSRSQPQPPDVEFLPQGDAPLPWSQP